MVELSDLPWCHTTLGCLFWIYQWKRLKGRNLQKSIILNKFWHLQNKIVITDLVALMFPKLTLIILNLTILRYSTSCMIWLCLTDDSRTTNRRLGRYSYYLYDRFSNLVSANFRASFLSATAFSNAAISFSTFSISSRIFSWCHSISFRDFWVSYILFLRVKSTRSLWANRSLRHLCMTTDNDSRSFWLSANSLSANCFKSCVCSSHPSCVTDLK